MGLCVSAARPSAKDAPRSPVRTHLPPSASLSLLWNDALWPSRYQRINVLY